MPGLLELLGEAATRRMDYGGAIKSIWGGITAPRDTYAGNLDPLSPEGISRINTLGSLAVGFPGTPRGALGSSFPRTAAEINPNTKVNLGTLYRGSEGGIDAATAMRHSPVGDLGAGIYVTPSENIASSYGGGPSASVKAGTRAVHSYELQSLYPEDVAYVFGGRKVGEPASLVSGNGIELWSGEWGSAAMEKAIQKHEGIKVVIGTPDSIGINQINVRDPSILTPNAR